MKTLRMKIFKYNKNGTTRLYTVVFSVAKATLESLMSLEGVVILNLGCGYIENGVVIFVRS